MENLSAKSEIKWNDQVKLIVSDVDETVADLYVPASKSMSDELSSLLHEGKSMVFVTGQSLESVQRRLLDTIDKPLRKNILVGHCNGAEVFSHDEDGSLREEPLYSAYESSMNEKQKEIWREQVERLIEEFKLKVYRAMPIGDFVKEAGDNPLAMMIEDRGSQITFEMVNGYNLSERNVSGLGIDISKRNDRYDLRLPVLDRARQLFDLHKLPITPRLGGMFAVDFAVKNVSKETAITNILNNEDIVTSLGLSVADIVDPQKMEIWGDRFSTLSGGDWHMSKALPKTVRSLDFREEDPEEFLPGYNTVIWNGKERLHDGLLEYLRSRSKA